VKDLSAEGTPAIQPDLIVFPELFVCGYVVGQQLKKAGEDKAGLQGLELCVCCG